jgi:hypothetical protein
MDETPAKRKPRTPPSPKQYYDAKMVVLEDYAPPVYPCKHCEWPVIKGYRCGWCGSDDPEKDT